MRTRRVAPWLPLLALSTCASPAPTPPPDAALATCGALFGAPNARTGLSEAACRPVCSCGAETFAPRVWTPAALAALRALTQLDPAAPLARDPYTDAPPAPDRSTRVCAARFVTAGSYRMQTFESVADATSAGAVVSHGSACGVCSSLADLAVYASTPDLTAPVRECGILNLGSFDGLVTCLTNLGFTRPCAQVWAYNTEHTRAACGAVCIRLLNAPYHTPDGALNACLACDETESGAVFKAVAGRTRRNTGIANAMCRPCTEVLRLTHAYPGV